MVAGIDGDREHRAPQPRLSQSAAAGERDPVASRTPTSPSPAGAGGSERALNGVAPLAQLSSRTMQTSEVMFPPVNVRHARNATYTVPS
jgi:hypothetical protein